MVNLIIIGYENKTFITLISFFRSVVRLSKPTAKKAKWRNYRENFIMFGFISVDSKCLECGAMHRNDSMKKVRLEHHHKSKRP